VFYRKAKNKQIEINKLKESLTQKEGEIVKLNEWIDSCEQTDELNELRKIRADAGLDKKQHGQVENLPFHEFEFKGYKILVGRNAEANDKLTLKYSYKDDLWLHAKDVAGSHVLIKHQSGKDFPKDVIEYAAGLAAYNSKRKNESLCPVAFTQKKYVRKRKGDPAGMVVVEREEVILVEPLSVNR
jgi:predicted ribosome quality control (RQC) complex YloA/Tae2 family protein